MAVAPALIKLVEPMLGQIGTFRFFEFDIGIGMAAGKKRGNISASCAPCQLVPGNPGHVHVDNRKIKTCRFNSLQGKVPVDSHLTLAASSTSRMSVRRSPTIRIVVSHQYRGHGGLTRIESADDIPFRPTHQGAL